MRRAIRSRIMRRRRRSISGFITSIMNSRSSKRSRISRKRRSIRSS